MKKVLSVIFCLMMGISSALADELTVSDITIPQGGNATLSVSLTNTGTYLQLFEFFLTLPEGVSLVENSQALSERFGSTTSLTYSKQNERVYKFICALAGIDKTPISGNSGVLMTVDLQADASLAVEATLEGTITNIELTTSESVAWNPANLSFTITIGEPDDGYIKFDENSNRLPTYTAGEKGNVRMKRTITAGQWSTIVLPFTLTKDKAEAAFGGDVQLAEFSGFDVNYGDDEDNVIPLGITINFAEYKMTNRKGMTGGKPFLIKTTQDITSFTADEVTLAGGVSDVEKSFTIDETNIAGSFTGSFVKTKVPADGLFISDNKFWYSTGETNIKAFRGWFELGAVLDKETDFGVKMNILVDGESTQVEGLSSNTTDESIYDLSGRKVAKAEKGVYIINGKKVLVK